MELVSAAMATKDPGIYQTIELGEKSQAKIIIGKFVNKP